MENNELHVVCIITQTKQSCDVYVPDFKITAHGIDFVEALANAILSTSAIYFYNRDKNVTIKLKTSFEDAEKMCENKNQFATVLTLTA